MYSFEGDFRRKPAQNLAGASAQRNPDRNALILQSQQQRQKREDQRKRLNSAIKIQAFIRSFLTREHSKQVEREHFDTIIQKAEANEDLLQHLLAKILFFYNVKKDYSRLIAISQLLLKKWKNLFKSEESSVQIRRLLAIHLKLLRGDSGLSVAIQLRMFEVFTSVSTLQTSMSTDEAANATAQTFLYLVKRGYFEDVLALLCQRTPPLFGACPAPPTPLAAALLDLIQRPLDLTASACSAPAYNDAIMTAFAAAYLCVPYPEAVENFILPALAQDPNRRFPFAALLSYLRDDKFSSAKLVNDSWLLHSVLILEPTDFVNQIQAQNSTRLPSNPLVLEYLKILAKLTVNVCNKQIKYEYADSLYSQETAADNDDSDSETEANMTSVREQMLLTRCIEILNEPERCVMRTCTQITDQDLCEEFLDSMSLICHNLLLSHKMALHKYRLLYTLAFKPIFLRGLWKWLSGLSHESSFGLTTSLLSALSRGTGLDSSVIGMHRLLAPLAVFCALFSLLIGTLHDTEFCRTDHDEDMDIIIDSTSEPSASAPGGRVHAFEFRELGALCRTLRQVCLGLVELAYPESRPAAVGQYRDAVAGAVDLHSQQYTPAWSHLFKVCTALVRALYDRDSRLQFCSSDGSDGSDGSAWTAAGAVPEGAAAVLLVAGTHVRPNPRQLRRPARQIMQDEGPPLTIKELRTVTILREIPFVVPFATRVLIFQGLLVREKHDQWYEMTNFNEGPMINISVRRTHLYEDAFDKLRPENEPNMKLKMRVQLINQAGAEEAGVDGGGLFREFLSELLKSAFDPNRGLFRLTRDNMLYPNPGVNLLYDDFPMHYYFVGRMLGKALYENLLVELPLAEFFLSKLCSPREGDVHALASLDPALYRGLLQLKSHARALVPDLGLDFTVVSDELGEQRIDELKPGGANIPVTAENRIEYIHLVADYKLNRQIRAQCAAFKRGLTGVVNAEWLRMFSCRELQLLVSGAAVPVDLADLRRHTHYAGGFSDTHPIVQSFWKVVENFTDVQKRQLLKFVTSCSRPPLLGFKDLQPPFCIQSAGAADRLPSSSTCMNLLKLPEFPEEAVLAERLLYAIQAGAGFELS